MQHLSRAGVLGAVAATIVVLAASTQPSSASPVNHQVQRVAPQTSVSAASVRSVTAANDDFGCRSQYVCLFLNKVTAGSTADPSGPHTDYKYYGYDNFSNVTSYHWIDNNQTDGAKVYLCTGYNGTSCGTFKSGPLTFKYVPAGYALKVNMTPINSIKLTK